MTTVTFFSLATKNSGLVATLATRFLYDLDLTLKSKVKQTFHIILLCFRHKNVPNSINKASLPRNLYWLLSVIFSNNQIWWIAPFYEMRHLNYTNWQLKICIWWLYFSRWLPKGNLRIFLILSPAGSFKLVGTGCCQNTFVINIFLFLAEGKLHYFIPQPSLQERLRGMGL